VIPAWQTNVTGKSEFRSGCRFVPLQSRSQILRGTCQQNKECGAMPKNPLIGSERQPLPGARSIGKADPTERLEVTLVLRHRQHDALQERSGK